jgi:hypothetical protein
MFRTCWTICHTFMAYHGKDGKSELYESAQYKAILSGQDLLENNMGELEVCLMAAKASVLRSS